MSIKSEVKRKKILIEQFKSKYGGLKSNEEIFCYKFRKEDLAPELYLNICPDANLSIQWLISHSSYQKIVETSYELYAHHFKEMNNFYEESFRFYHECFPELELDRIYAQMEIENEELQKEIDEESI